MEKKNASKTIRIILFSLLFAIILFLYIRYRDQITVEQIVNYTPSEPLAAAFIMLVLFAVKSFCIFIYCGILYAASGLMFPLPIAIAVNIVGTFIMTSIPYAIGRRAGGAHVEKLFHKYPKLEIVRELKDKDGLFASFFVRIIGLLPSDPVSMVFGAGRVPFWKYTLGTLLGILPMIIVFSVMGTNINDPTSPAFITSACIMLGLTILSMAFYLLRKHIQKKNSKGGTQIDALYSENK